ncbi:MAG: hypothetical protein IPK77_05980 [Cellvibrio sp.]|nr:hypothetical protein [Cellvibrio sp.]
MRSIFIVLIIANIGLFMHQYLMVGGKESISVGQQLDLKEEGERLEFLAEKKSGRVTKRKRPIAEESINDVGEKNIGENPMCSMVGPFEQLIRAEFLVERLKSLSVESVITPVERIEGSVFWVYLQPELSQQDALMRLYELQKKNIESYIITKGELDRGISFGQYAERVDAELRADEIKKQGYEPQIKEMKKTVNETWVTLSPLAAEKISESVWLDILSAEAALERRQNFCISVASQ